MGLDDPVGAPKGVARAQRSYLDGSEKLLGKDHRKNAGSVFSDAVTPDEFLQENVTDMSFSTYK